MVSIETTSLLIVLPNAAQPSGNDAHVSAWKLLYQLPCQARMPHSAGDICSEIFVIWWSLLLAPHHGDRSFPVSAQSTPQPSREAHAFYCNI